MGKWFKRRKDDNQTMVLQGIEGFATRAVYQGANLLPTIELRFKVRHGYDARGKAQFDEVEIEMDLYTASKFGDQFLASMDAAMPKMPKAMGRYQYGE